MISNVRILVKKEVRDFFASPLVYIVGALFSLLMGWIFFNYLISAKEFTNLTLSQSVLNPIYGMLNFILIFITPIITMRTFAEEKKGGTLDLLLLSRLSSLEIILGKFFASLSVVLFLLSLTLILPIILAFSGYSDWMMVLSSYSGLVLASMAYVSVGIFTSSLTENQIVAAFMSYILLFGIMLFMMTANASDNPLLGQIFQYFSFLYHFEGFIRGSLKSYNFIYFGSFIGFFFFLTNRSLDSRNW